MKNKSEIYDLINLNKTILIIVLAIIVSLFEFVGLALIAPYILIASSRKIPENDYLDKILTFFNLSTFEQFFFFATVGIISFYLIRLIINLIFNFSKVKFVNNIKRDAMINLYYHFMHISYKDFTVLNSSYLKKHILVESSHIQNTVTSTIDLITESVILLTILSLMFVHDTKLALILFSFLLLIFVSVIFSLKKLIKKTAVVRESFGKENIKFLDESLNNIKFIKLVGALDSRTNKFKVINHKLSKSVAFFQTLNLVPRNIFETIGLLIIVTITVYLMSQGSTEIIASLTIYAIGFYRLLPSLTRIINGYNSIQSYKYSIHELAKVLAIPTEKDFQKKGEPILFNDKIELKNLNFKHKNAKDYLFKDFSLTINKGAHVALIGESGSGKSTLIDILTGLLKMDHGKLTVDGVEIGPQNLASWRQEFGYIPQEIFLSDGTVGENVAFGRDYNEEKIVAALQKAQIWETLKAKDGLNTFVGDKGIQLSGGQKQRIGIARAIYDDPEILVLDEATSALDEQTESEVINEIYNLGVDKTLIIITHKLSTIKNCKQKIYL